MTYHLENQLNKSTDEFVLIFPYKLFDAANSNLDLIKWTKDGNSILVYTSFFEEKVIDMYPSLVEIPQFTNFRRQMRAYGFTWYQHKEDLFEFSHTYFKRYQPDLLKFVLTRRKQMKFDSVRSRNLYKESTLDDVVNTPFKLRKTMKSRSRTPINYATIQKRPYRTKSKIQEDSIIITTPKDVCPPQNEDQVEKLIPIQSINTKPSHTKNSFFNNKVSLKERLFDLEVFHSCQSWMLQQDPWLARQFELDLLNDSLQHVQRFVDIPIHFYD